MEKFNHVVTNDGWKLPLGVRFHPTDEELLVYYLKRKCFFLPLPASVIPEFDVFVTSPWKLPGNPREKRYFFSNKEQDVNTNKKRFRKDVGGFGCWLQSGKDKKIIICGTNPVVGIRRTLIFHGGTHPNFTKTRWIMHEFHLEESPLNTSNSMQMSNVGYGNWKVYKVSQKKIRPKKHENIVSQASAIVIDFKNEDTAEFSPPPPPSPSSSLVDDKETTF